MHVHVHNRQRSHWPALLLVAVALLAGAGCGAREGSDAVAAPVTAPADGTGSRAARSYTTEQFAVPLTVTVDPRFDPHPAIDSPNLLSFDAATGDEEKVRFLVPTVTYVPGSSTPEEPPADFLAYLHAQVPNGLRLSEETSTVVGGRPATLLTGTSEPGGSYDGSLGCQTPDTDPGECFGVQPEFALRLAVVPLDSGDTLLIWARRYSDHDDPENVRAFEAMLQTVRFR
jgi:hypothetical protein